MTLGEYVARRLLQMIPVVAGVTILVFFMIHLVPGDPAATILGNQATPARVAAVRHAWGLDKPLYVQYWKFMGRVVHGNLGDSLFYGVSAGHLVLQRLPVTLWLIIMAAILAVADRRPAGCDRSDQGRPRSRPRRAGGAADRARLSRRSGSGSCCS